MIRDYRDADWHAINQLHLKSGLPEVCLPDVNDPLYLIRRVIEDTGRVVMGGFVRLAAEPFLLVDHEWANPGMRWLALADLCEDICAAAKQKGLLQLTCWIPPDIEESFGRRLEGLGFVKSPWVSYTRNL